LIVKSILNEFSDPLSNLRFLAISYNVLVCLASNV